MRTPAAVPTVALALLLSACAMTAHVPPPEPSGEPVLPGSDVSTTVNTYFHYRKLALVARNAEILWTRYPHLRDGEDVPRGVNVEGHLAMRSGMTRSLVDVIYDIDRYERMRMHRVGDELVVRVHGLERYIEADFSDGTAGEFIIDLYLRRDLDTWLVVKTDAMNLAEFHGRAPRR